MKTTLTRALILLILDALIMNQGGIAILTVLVIVFWLLPKALFLKYKKQSPREVLDKVAIYGLMAMTVFLLNFVNNALAQHRAEALIMVIEKYHQTTGHYPENLSALVPSYLPEIPIAKYVLLFNCFLYMNHQGDAALSYVRVPPYGRSIYSFKRKEWSSLD